jgi:hypothetical protein
MVIEKTQANDYKHGFAVKKPRLYWPRCCLPRRPFDLLIS